MTITCEKRLSNDAEDVLPHNMKTESEENANSPEMESGAIKRKKAKKRKAETTTDKNSKLKKTSTPNGLPEVNNSLETSKRNLEIDHAKGNGESGEDETEQTEPITDKEARQMSGKSLRTSFNSADGLIMLKKFIAVCNDNKKFDLAAQYLNAGGSPLEILKLLDTTEKKNLGNATTVFSALEIVIMKILEKYPQYHSSASEACRHLVNSHLSSIHSMLSSQSNAKQRKVVLRLLTAVVSLGGNLPRELLGHLSLHSQVLETLTKHTQPSDLQSVRTSFIHFILSFLVEGNVSVVRALLDKRGVISCIFPELIYDTHYLVNLVLTTIKTYVLENQGISKTIKLHTFSTPVVQSLVSLYNWKGPKNWSGKNRKKHEENSGHTDPEEKKVVVEVVHEFLLTLLTSNKFGIIFHDRSLGTSGQKNNQLADTILQSLDRPWEHAKPADLVVKILVACPDLIKAQLLYTESYLEPVVSRKWILLMEFIKQIVESLDPEVCFKPCLTELTTLQLFSALTTLTVPPIILKNAIAPSMNHESIVVRHTAVILLTVMLKQLKNFMNTVRNNSVDPSEIAKIENLVTDYVLKNIPSLESVLNAWNKALVQEKESEEESKLKETISFPTRKESLTIILDLLLMYRDVCAQMLETGSISSSGIDSTTLLKGLNTLDNVDEEELGKMKVKALQFLLALDPSAFTPNKELFSEAVPFLISLLDTPKESTPVGSHARIAIKALFNTCGAFEGCNYQADIWISSCLDSDKIEERVEIANWLVELIRETAKHANKYVELIIKAEEAAGEQLYSRTTIEDIFTDLMERDVEIGRNKTARLLPPVSISPLLAAALENVKTAGRKLLLDYLSRVTAHSLHCQVAPSALIHLVKTVEELPSQLYITSWMPNGEHINMKKPFGSKSLISKLSKALITDNKIDISQIFQGKNRISFKIQEEEFSFDHSMNADEVLASFRLSLFYFTRLIQEEKLTEETNSNIKLVLMSLLHVAKDIETIEGSFNLSEECCKWTISHPVMLQYFSPLYKKKNLIEKYSTEMIAYICPAIAELFGDQKISDLLVPFKDKFITKLLSSAKKLRNGDHVKDFPSAIRFVKILQLNIEDIIEILVTILELPSEKLVSSDKSHLSMWGLLIPELLATSVTQTENHDHREFLTLDKSLIEKISQFMIGLSISKNEEFDLWVDNLLAHLKRFPHNIEGIDKNLFLSLIKGKSSPSAIELASFLISRNVKFISVYMKYALQNTNTLKDREAVFSILSSMRDESIRSEFLQKLYDLYKDEILGWFSDPETVHSCIKKNVKAAVRLIETVMDLETCDKTCEMILSNGDKLLTVDESYIELLKSVFTKAAQAKDIGENRLVDFAQILIHITVSALKKESKNTEKHNSLCQTLLDILNLVETSANDSRFHEIKKNHSWPQFTRFSLKLGIKNSKENNNQVKLLKTLVKLCDVVYENNSDDEYVKTLFEMTTSHSEFINVMLGASSAKRDLVELLLILVRKNNSLMASIHVPLYLGAYNATLSETDQLILQLLQYYESHNVRLTDYRPYLWGSAAASHYSVKSGADTALWRQPSTSQVLDLFSQETVISTVKNYPVKRKLKSTELHAPQSTYDPAFYLPLLCYLLSDNSVVACHKITQSGALALALSACGSTEKETRLAALTVISRFYYHLEATNSKEKLLWMHFIDIFRNGISSSKPELEDIQLSCLVTTFMAQTSLVATQPLNPLYSPLQKFLMAKPALDLTSVPEFLQLFHSSEIDHKIHRFWILEVVRDGLKTSIDMEIAFKCVLFKMLLGFYSCVLADRQSKNLILQVVNSAVKIPNACVLLVTGYGLLPWLHEIIYLSDTHDTDFVTVLIDVICHIFESLAKSTEKTEDMYFMLLKTTLNLKRHISCRNTDIKSYKNYITTLEKITSVKANEFCKNLSIKDMTELVHLSKTILGEVNECEDMLQFGSKFSKKTSSSLGEDDITIAKYGLKKLLIMWCSSKGI